MSYPPAHVSSVRRIARMLILRVVLLRLNYGRLVGEARPETATSRALGAKSLTLLILRLFFERERSGGGTMSERIHAAPCPARRAGLL